MRPTLVRIARVAKTLFGAPFADVTLFPGSSGIWRASDAEGRLSGQEDPASALAMQADEVLWVENLIQDERFAEHPMVSTAPGLRFYAGAPIMLEQGERLGALSLYDSTPRPYNATLSARLADLAAVVAHECDRQKGIRDRAEMMERMSRSEQRLKLAVENADLHCYEIDYVSGTLWKLGAEESFYEQPKTFNDISKDVWSTVHPEDLERTQAEWMRHRKEGVPYRSEYRINRSDGREVWVFSTAELIRDKARKPLRLVGAIQNITERKRAERAMEEAKEAAEAANVAKTAFLATMSHEIRTPLNGVLGMAQAMATDELSAEQRDRLVVIQQSGEALLAILNDILDLSKIEAGKLELENIEFDFADIARGAHAAFSALAHKKGLEFALDIEDAKGVYCGDPTRVRQVLYNLISNALKFTDAGEIRVRASYSDGRLFLVVVDTGIGMSRETVSQLFSKFHQADASTTRKFGGTGLGLAICRELSELMGGSINVDSEEGKGSTFLVTLPLLRMAEGREPPAALPSPDVAPSPAVGLRVLAAEDNAVNQLVLKTLLSQVGIDPVMVDNGALCVQAWENGQFDMILMDVQMPVMDGPTATREIRDREAALGLPRTPIIALTANAMAHQLNEYLAAGMDGHVTKPMEAAKLFEAIEQAAELRSSALESSAVQPAEAAGRA